MSRRHAFLAAAWGCIPIAACANCNWSPSIPLVAVAHVAGASNADTSLEAAERWIELGYAPYAAQRLRKSLAAGTVDERSMPAAISLLALAQSQLGDEKAARDLAAPLHAASVDLPPRERAAVLLRLASINLRAGLIDRGASLLEESARLARASRDHRLELIALLNLARSPAPRELRIARAERLMAALAESNVEAVDLRVRLLAFRIALESGSTDSRIPSGLTEAFARASAQDRPPDAAEALGALGEWHHRRGNHARAVEAIDRAFALAAGAGVPGAVDWSWTRARALVGSGQSQAAIAAYAASISHARASRAVAESALLGLGVTYRERYGELFLEYADILLRASVADSRAARQQVLRSVIDTVEVSKAAEVADFFRDPCIAPEAPALRADAVDPRAAVLYPVIFENRTELLLSHREGIDRYTVSISREEIGRRVDRFRELLEKRTTRQYLRPARDLHKLLIEPLEARLKELEIGVLIVVPDGALRTVPFAALHDGTRHLVERLALVTSPGLSMTSAKALAMQRVQGVVQGLSVARHGFTALPSVLEELELIATTLSTVPIVDEDFTQARLEREMLRARANVVHIASHGQFSSDIQNTFLLAYDQKVDLDSLRRAISAGKTKEEPLELLTLSACQTAVGDERAALGLAGVALRAGARSAVASLWSVSDESTTDLISHFYTELVTHGRSRAEALRAAQLHLIADERFSHAAYWGAFMLIGSWL